jgi:hypothetical protein
VWQPGERAPVVKRQDNLQPEGAFETRVAEDWLPGERAPVVKRPDNLRPEGAFTDR